MAAGLIAGLLAGGFAFFVGEPVLDRAIALEAAASGVHGHAGAPGHQHEAPVFDRPAQKLGLFLVMGLFGVTVGGIFGVLFAYFRGRLASDSDWVRSLCLTSCMFTGAFLIPFVKYPANPPGVRGAAAIGERTVAYYSMVALSLLAVLTAWMAARMLRERGVKTPVRHLSVGLGLALASAALFVLLPAAPDPGGFPAGLLWDFRLASLGTQLVFWAGLGVVFGLLCGRANSGVSV